jgi:hypothetical protein
MNNTMSDSALIIRRTILLTMLILPSFRHFTMAADTPGDGSKAYIELVTRENRLLLVNKHETKAINVELKRTRKDGKTDKPFAGVRPKAEHILAGTVDADTPMFEVLNTTFGK